MRSLLRPGGASTIISHSLLRGSTRSSTRNSRLILLDRSSLASQCCRGYATKRSPKPKDDRDKSKDEQNKQKADSENESQSVTKDDSKSGKTPPGFEHFYKDKSLSTPPAEQKESSTEETTEKSSSGLTKEQQERLNNMLEKMLPGLPSSMQKDARRSIEDLKKHGMPKELQEMVHKLNKGEPLTLSTAARFIRIMTKVASQGAARLSEEDRKRAQGEEKSSSSEQKKQREEKKTGSQEQFRMPEFKLDTTTVITSAFFAWTAYRWIMPSDNQREITWQEFRTSFMDKGLVEKLVVINHNLVKVYVHRDALRSMHPDSPAVNDNFFYVFSIGSVEAFERQMEKAQKELDIPSSERIPVSYTSELSWMSTLLSIGPTLFTIGFLVFLSRRFGGGGGGGSSSGIFGMGKSRAKKFNHETDIKIKFKDVAGMDEAKQEIMEFVSFLKQPEQFQRLGAKIPRGAILSGPPGTGKTLLAKATAGESQVPFFSVSGSEFVEMFVGVGASRVRDLFANARKSTPCIIFIDEIDAIGKSRSKQGGWGGGNDEREATLNQILTEMDGFNTSEQVVVLAGTNRPDVLDSALMRPGRFDRHISIDKPTMEGRKQIFAVHTRQIVTDEEMENLTGRLSALTPGFSGADIANACNEAALIG